jgi:DNA-binding NarL/FixJ family response regulator
VNFFSLNSNKRWPAVTELENVLNIHVIILTTHSLFAEGVACRLKNFSERVQITVVDPRQPDVIDHIMKTEPEALILDVHDAQADHVCSMITNLSKLSRLKIIRLDAQHDQIQVITSRKFLAGEVQDLIDIIEEGTVQ